MWKPVVISVILLAASATAHAADPCWDANKVYEGSSTQIPFTVPASPATFPAYSAVWVGYDNSMWLQTANVAWNGEVTNHISFDATPVSGNNLSGLAYSTHRAVLPQNLLEPTGYVNVIRGWPYTPYNTPPTTPPDFSGYIINVNGAGGIETNTVFVWKLWIASTFAGWNKATGDPPPPTDSNVPYSENYGIPLIRINSGHYHKIQFYVDAGGSGHLAGTGGGGFYGNEANGYKNDIPFTMDAWHTIRIHVYNSAMYFWLDEGTGSEVHYSSPGHGNASGASTFVAATSDSNTQHPEGFPGILWGVVGGNVLQVAKASKLDLYTAYAYWGQDDGKPDAKARGMQHYCDPKACHSPIFDLNGDASVDMDDFGVLQVCWTGDITTSYNADLCHCLDVNGDRKINETDLARFLACASGPAVPADPACR